MRFPDVKKRSKLLVLRHFGSKLCVSRNELSVVPILKFDFWLAVCRMILVFIVEDDWLGATCEGILFGMLAEPMACIWHRFCFFICLVCTSSPLAWGFLRTAME